MDRWRNRRQGLVDTLPPKHPPASAEIDVIFEYLGVKTFDQCPQFDFEPCYYRFIPNEAHEEHFFGSNAQAIRHARYKVFGGNRKPT